MHAIMDLKGMEASSTHSKPRHYLEMNHELNVLAALQRGKSVN
jgi:hypothetical protein